MPNETLQEDNRRSEATVCWSRGRWDAVWDRAERDDDQAKDISPGWRIAWVIDHTEYVWKKMTFARKSDAERAVKAIGKLGAWKFHDLDEMVAFVNTLPDGQFRKTILDSMAW